ncbi:MAG TPA: hypothetical protein VIR16_13150 [Candidatus Limnocylindrales bacterium]
MSTPSLAANTHVHLPPNFSAFDDVEDAVAAAAREGIRVMGGSNFHDLRVYRRFAAAAHAAGIVPLYGLELISVVEPLRAAGTRVNDPANPGRMYLCGKGVDPFREPTAEAARIDAASRAANRARAARMTSLLRDRFAAAGVALDIDDTAIAADVAARAGVPADWVVLQERHLAMAFQQALFAAVAPDDRAARLAAAYGVAPSSVDDPGAVQGEIRSRLMRAGGPAFVEETALSFEDAYRLILEWGGIPAYPTLADGTSPLCPFEADPLELVRQLRELGIHAAELIPVRNAPETVDAYVDAFRSAGMVVTAGTEHNTPARIPVQPTARGGAPLSEATRAILYEGACVVAGHQAARAAGEPGFVDEEGRLGPGDPEARIRRFAAIGAELIERRSVPA